MVKECHIAAQKAYFTGHACRARKKICHDLIFAALCY